MYANSFLGKKKLLFVSCLIMSVTGILPAFSINIWMYVIIRFFSGLGRGSLVTCTVVLLTERVGRNWQGRVGILDHLFFSYGTLFLPVLAFSTRRYSWRVLYLCTGIPVSVYCVIAYHLVAIHARLYRRSNHSFKTNFLKDLLDAIWCLLVLILYAFGNGIAYFGLMLYVGQLDFSLYLSVFVNGLTEMPLLLITFFLLENCNRKSSFLSSSIIGGIDCILTWLGGTGQR
ncbi:Major facilitator superfamily - like 10, partial [Theobroma cacao]